MKSSVFEQWDDVRLFLALFRTRRLALGGKQLHVDTSTASRRLARLESAARVESAAQEFLRLRRGRVKRAIGQFLGA